MNALRWIRTEVFGLTQADFAALLGRAQSTVARWEGGVAPSLDDMTAIRAAAGKSGIEWRDEWFFKEFPNDDVTGAPSMEAAE